eukprot:TRINITY_DN29842_c0_g1_i1.p1 TRINITY_DN29842_c0_g1~~TRINITY_DN29842_c0_g1_i1.p1  ORF type:complete len:1690 (+),score=365.37 TRINITY_DN29842_c0_g1_i1:138-5207(+)
MQATRTAFLLLAFSICHAFAARSALSFSDRAQAARKAGVPLSQFIASEDEEEDEEDPEEEQDEQRHLMDIGDDGEPVKQYVTVRYAAVLVDDLRGISWDAFMALRYFSSVANANFEDTASGRGKIVHKTSIVSLMREDKTAEELKQEVLGWYFTMARYQGAKSPDPVDAFLGPSIGCWNHDVAEMLAPFNIPLVLWAFEELTYNYLMQPLPLLWGVGSFDPSIASYDDSRKPLVDDRPSSTEWNENWTHVFDINLHPDDWATDMLEKIHSGPHRELPGSGGSHSTPKSYTVLWFGDDDGEGGEEALADARRCRKIVEHMEATTGPETVVYSFELSFLDDFRLDIQVMKALHADVTIICGGQNQAATLVLALQDINYSPKAMAFDRPIAGPLLMEMLAITADFLMFPLPIPVPMLSDRCPFFGIVGDFITQFETDYGYPMSMAALQVASTSVMILEAIKAAPDLDTALNGLSTHIPHYFRSHLMHTLLGSTGFSHDGRITGIRPSTLQIEELSMPKQAFVKYFFGDLVIVSPEARQSCLEYAASSLLWSAEPIDRTPFEQPFGQCERGFKDSLGYPMPNWADKLLILYPCSTGCQLHNFACHPCSPGKFRSEADSKCMACPPGRYAHMPASAQCEPCPHGAVCSDPARIPDAKYGNFMDMFEITSNGSWIELHQGRDNHYDSINGTATPEQIEEAMTCASERSRLTYLFFECSPSYICEGSDVNGTQKCLGNNTGFLCGQCKEGYSSYTLTPGARTCEACPGFIHLGIRCVVIFVVFLVIVMTWSFIGLDSTFDPNSLACALIRAYVHYFHILGAVLEGSGLEASPALHWLVLPLNLVNKPMAMLQLDCFGMGHPLVATAYFHRVLVFVGIGCLVLIWLAQMCHQYYQFLVVLVVQIAVALKNCILGFFDKQQRRKRAQELEDSTEDHPSIHLDVDELDDEPSPRDSRDGDGAASASIAYTVTPEAFAKDFAKTMSSLHHTVHTMSSGVKLTDLTELHTKAKHGLQGATELSAKALQGSTEFIKNAPQGAMDLSLKAAHGAIDLQRKVGQGAIDLTAQAKQTLSLTKTKSKEFQLTVGPGRHFQAMHDNRFILTEFWNLMRSIIIWLLLMQPILVRNAATLGSCTAFYNVDKSGDAFARLVETPATRRLTADFDVLCTSEEHRRLAIGKLVFVDQFGLWIFPFLLLLVLIIVSKNILSISVRRVFSVLFEGYRPTTIFWEVLVVVRTTILWLTLGVPEPIIRVMLQAVFLVVFLALHVIVRPHDTRDRDVLNRFEGLVIFGTLLLATEGLFARRGNTLGTTSMIVLASGFNFVIMLYGVMAWVRSTVSLPLQAIVEAGGVIGSYGFFFHRLCVWIWGLNPVFTIHQHGGEYVDISRLYERERRTLVASFSSCISACIDSGDTFHTWLVENAMREAFRRALNTRSAMLRSTTEQYGTRSFSLSPLLRFVTAAMPAPDIPTRKVREEVGSEDAAKANAATAAAPAGNEVGVTVDELYVALQGVSTDVLDHYPPLRQWDGEEGEDERDQKYHDDLVAWEVNTPLAAVFDTLKERGLMEKNKEERRLVLRVSQQEQEDSVHGAVEGLAGQLYLEAAEKRQQLKVEEHALRDRLKALGKELQEVRQQLGHTGGQGRDYVSLAKEGDDREVAPEERRGMRHAGSTDGPDDRMLAMLTADEELLGSSASGDAELRPA